MYIYILYIYIYIYTHKNGLHQDCFDVIGLPIHICLFFLCLRIDTIPHKVYFRLCMHQEQHTYIHTTVHIRLYIRLCTYVHVHSCMCLKVTIPVQGGTNHPAFFLSRGHGKFHLKNENEIFNVCMCVCVWHARISYWRMQNNCSSSDRFITVQCRIFALSMPFFNVYYKQ